MQHMHDNIPCLSIGLIQLFICSMSKGVKYLLLASIEDVRLVADDPKKLHCPHYRLLKTSVPSVILCYNFSQ